jgi:hypothetical protein
VDTRRAWFAQTRESHNRKRVPRKKEPTPCHRGDGLAENRGPHLKKIPSGQTCEFRLSRLPPGTSRLDTPGFTQAAFDSRRCADSRRNQRHAPRQVCRSRPAPGRRFSRQWCPSAMPCLVPKVGTGAPYRNVGEAKDADKATVGGTKRIKTRLGLRLGLLGGFGEDRTCASR